MNIQTSRKYTRNIILTLIIVSLLAVVVTARETRWFDKRLPSQDLSFFEKEQLKDKNITQWKSTYFWKEGNCYYYDLTINEENTGKEATRIIERGIDENNNTIYINETYIVPPAFVDSRRELFCGKNLTNDEIESLQLADISWTLQQLSVDPIDVIEPVRTKADKGEDIKNNKIIDNNILIDVSGIK